MGRIEVYRITIAGVLVVIILGSIAVILTLPAEPTAEQYRAGLLSAIAVPAIATLLTLLRTDTVNNKVDIVRSEVNGHLESHNQLLESALKTVKDVKVSAIQAGVNPTELPPDPSIPPPSI